MPKITELYAFVSYDRGDPDNEGIMAMLSKRGWLPMVGADMKRPEDLRKVADKMGVPYRMLRFKLDGEIE